MEMLENRFIQLPSASAVVIPIGDTVAEVLQIAAELRASGIRTSIDTSRRKLGKALATLSSRGIRYVLLIGENEQAAGKVTLKDMAEKQEWFVCKEEAIHIISKGS